MEIVRHRRQIHMLMMLSTMVMITMHLMMMLAAVLSQLLLTAAIPSRILLSLKHPRVTLLAQVLRTGMVIAFPRPRGRRQLNALRGNTNVTKTPIFKVSLTQNLRYQTVSLSPSGAPAMKTLQTTATTNSNQNGRSGRNARHRQKLISISRCVMEIMICLTLLLR